MKKEAFFEKIEAVKVLVDEIEAYAKENLGEEVTDAADKAKKTEKAPKNSKKVDKKPAKAKEPEPEPEDDDDEDGDLTAEELEDMDLKELLKVAKDYGIEIPKKDLKKEDKVRAAILEAMDDDEDEDSDDDEDDDSDEETPDFDEMSLKELLAYAKEHDIVIDKKIAKKEDKVRAAIVEATEDEDGDDDDEDDDEGVDLDSMNLKELLALAEEQEIEVPKKLKKDKEKLVEYLYEQLGEDDDDEDDEEGE